MYPELEKAPKDHHSEEFLQYLRENNEIVKETFHWLIIKNCKYDRADRPWLTAFWKHTDDMRNSLQYGIGLLNILSEYEDWAWLKKPASEQTVQRFHVHIYK